MDIDLYVVTLIATCTLVGVGLRYKATLFTTVGGLVALSGLGYLVSSQNLVLRTFNVAGILTPQNATATDYTLAITVLVIATVTAFYITQELRIEGRVTS